MATIVQKFGGSSVADPERIRRCVLRAKSARDAGNRVVVVVSAMGKTTDQLIGLARQVSDRPTRREMDQLMAAGEQISIALTAIALGDMGLEAVSMTGPQVGMRTDAAHTRARIQGINREKIDAELDRGRVVVVAGFQGVTDDGDVTTLGRGGSDTTAVALAAAIGADVCEIFTDVDGVYTADPRHVPSAKKLRVVSYEEMFELASLGAKVMAARAMFLGMKYSVPIRVRHAMLEDEGTLIVREADAMEAEMVTGVALKENIGRVTITDLPPDAGAASAIFAAVGEAGILVDDIIQNQVSQSAVNISFTLDAEETRDVQPILEKVLAELESTSNGRWTGTINADVGLSRVSAVGVGMRTQSGVAARMFGALARAEGGPVHVQNITTSEIKIACIVTKDDGPRAMRAVHDAFGLGRPGPGA